MIQNNNAKIIFMLISSCTDTLTDSKIDSKIQ